jgi:hypothetical protein
MKRYSTILLFFLLSIYLINTSLAQKLDAAGPRIGLNIIPASKDEVDGRTYQLGNNIGGYTHIKINQWFSIRGELYYSLKKKTYEYPVETSSLFNTLAKGFGGAFIDTSAFSSFQGFVNDTVYTHRRGKVNLSYIELPVSAVMSLKSWNIGIGTYVAFLVKGKAKEETSQDIPALKTIGTSLNNIPFFSYFMKGLFPSYYSPTVSENNGRGPYKSFDFGLVGDVSYTFSNNINIGLRYSSGLINYRKNALKKRDYNSYIQISLAYSFGSLSSGKPKAIYDLDKPVTN